MNDEILEDIFTALVHLPGSLISDWIFLDLSLDTLAKGRPEECALYHNHIFFVCKTLLIFCQHVWTAECRGSDAGGPSHDSRIGLGQVGMQSNHGRNDGTEEKTLRL